MNDRVFGLMTRRSVDVVRQDDAGSTKRADMHQRDDERDGPPKRVGAPQGGERRLAAEFTATEHLSAPAQ